MGGTSTSKDSAILGGQTHSSAHAFDLRSWEGLTKVLKAGKESLKDPSAYAEFRNLVLEYAQKGGDKEIQKKIIEITNTFGAVVQTNQDKKSGEERTVPVQSSVTEDVSQPATKEKSTTPDVTPASAEKRGIPVPTRRPTPSFLPHTIEPSETSVEDNAPITKEEIEAHAVTPAAPTNVETVSAPSAGEQAVSHHTEKPLTPKEDTISVSDSTPSYKSMDEYKARITEIKRSVLDRVGNPATLVDTHNASGKAYMVALLTALKATGAGSPVGIETAMKALEDAYQTLIQEAGSNTEESGPQESVESNNVEDVPPPTPEPELVPDVSQASPEPEAPDIEIASQKEEHVTPPVTVHTPTSDVPMKSIPGLGDVPQKDIEHAKNVNIAPQQEVVTVDKVAQAESIPKSTIPTPADVSASFTLHKPASSSVSIPGVSDHVRETKEEHNVVLDKKETQTHIEEKKQAETDTAPAPVRKPPVWTAHKQTENNPAIDTIGLPQTVRKNTGKENTVQQSELAQPKVTKALDALLHEWPLFANSGILGIGPGGFEHPLYKKLSMLSMGEVLAGRFDKADPKVIKTIKQYVDAWRHEQEIAYTINETFEHYLRRVVQRIMRKQHG